MLIIGHRGAPGTTPENTLASFERAVNIGVKMIELDVHLCKEGELMVIHDEKINRTTDGKGKVAAKTCSELQQYDAGKGEKIPTLREVFNLINRRAKINIELKGPRVAEPVFRLISEYKNKRGWETDDFCISSFDHRQLFRFRTLDKETPVGILYKRNPRGFAGLAQKLQAFSINIPLHAAKAKTIEKIHDSGLEVWVYTVNEPEDFLRMEKLGVDAVFTNFPERFLRV